VSTHIMVDIETWSTNSNATIISIGACAFDPMAGEPTDMFYVAIDAASAHQLGMVVDADTVLWWMSPERTAAREAWLKEEKLDIHSALGGFADWIKLHDPVGVWGNGATFDNVVLLNAFARVGISRPWSYKADRCYRTIKALAPAIPFDTVGTYHNALDDAVGQALHLRKIVDHLGLVL
jgi:hypothetical protein